MSAPLAKDWPEHIPLSVHVDVELKHWRENWENLDAIDSVAWNCEIKYADNFKGKTLRSSPLRNPLDQYHIDKSNPEELAAVLFTIVDTLSRHCLATLINDIRDHEEKHALALETERMMKL
jgi:hypothetical protein